MLDVAAAIAELQRQLADLASTTAARLVRRPTGDIEPTLRTTAKPDTLLLDGATISRTVYSSLWAWVSENSLSPAVFGPGDGATTFSLPDMSGRVLMGSGKLLLNGGVNGNDEYRVGQIGGFTLRAIGLGALPRHSHGGTTGWSDRPHRHGGQTDHDGGGHGRHWDGPGLVGAGGNAAPIKNAESDGRHSHHFTTATEDVGHMHGFTTGEVGDGLPFDVRQPYFVCNYLIWT
jgi:microcystin-dependent protein